MTLRKNIIYISVITLLALLLLNRANPAAMASAVQPGTAADPLVSKSYVDDKFNQLVNNIGGVAQQSGSTVNNTVNNIELEDLVTDAVARIEFMYGDKLSSNFSGEASGAVMYMPVSADTGQTIICGEGTEIILRSGSAVGFCPGQNGLVNVTDGSEVTHGVKIKPNNLLIVPRNDGRGLTVTENAWFMVKGDYKIIN